MPHQHILRPALNRLPGVVAGYSTREGGVSTGAFAAMNLGLSTRDQPESVRQNVQRFFGAFGISPEQVATAEQVHEASVATVSAPARYDGVDGLVTAVPGIALAIAAADCAAILMADATARVVGACHSGWRGTAANVIGATINRMRAMGALPDRMHAFIGPCISAEHFEVGEEVAAQFPSVYVVRRDEWQRPHVDLKTALFDQLRTEGLRPDAIEVSPHCTYAETKRFFSYRAEAGNTGRMLGFVMLT